MSKNALKRSNCKRKKHVKNKFLLSHGNGESRVENKEWEADVNKQGREKVLKEEMVKREREIK